MTPTLKRSAKTRLARLYMNACHRRRVAGADALLISFAKSGRTWLRAMIGKVIVDQLGVGEEEIFRIDRLSRSSGWFPTIVETHDGGTVRGRVDDVSHSKMRYRGKRVVFMARDPRDVVVSAFFQASRRKRIFDGTIGDFLRSPIGSLDTILTFYNTWASERHVPEAFHLVRYEDLHVQPAQELEGVLAFLDIRGVGREQLEQAIRFASFDNMRTLETDGRTSPNSIVLRPINEDDRESYKTRRGKVGGFRDYLTSEEVEYVNRRISTELDPFYQYTEAR